MATFPVSDYPGAPDSDIPVPVDGQPITSDWGKGVRNAIVATQTELGVDPSGSAATVAARFTAVESSVSSAASAASAAATAAATAQSEVDALEAVVAGLGGTVGATSLVTALDQGSTPATLVVLGDSTGVPPGGDWVDNLAVLIGARWPLRKVTVRTWNGSSAYGSASTVANGSATPVLDIYNGSQGGALASYPVSRIAAMVPVKPDAVVLSFGHNHTTESAATFQTALSDLVTAVRATWPGAPIVVSSQNPQYSPATSPAAHNTRQASLRAWAASRGFVYLPGYEAFMAQVSPSAFMQADGVHPTLSGTSDGGALWADAGLRALTAASLAPVTATGGVADGIGYVYRDRLTASAGNNTLTLGATPVANSPLVWVNGAIKWPTTDYTVAGSVITFNVALAASDVVAVQYHSVATTASASTLTTVSAGAVADNFNRADSTTTLGTTSGGAKTWAVSSGGTWGIISNQAYLAAGGGAAVRTALVDSALSDGTVSVKMYGGANEYYGLVVRSDGAGNDYLVQLDTSNNNISLVKRVGGTSTLTVISGASVGVLTSADTISCVMSGSSFTIKKNGTTVSSGTDSSYNTQTKHGIWCFAGGTTRFDDFAVTA